MRSPRMETQRNTPVATVDGVDYARIPVIGSLLFVKNPTLSKFFYPKEFCSKEIDLLCPDLTAFAFLIRGVALEPVVCDGWYAVFSQDRPPEEKEFVLVQTKTEQNHFGRIVLKQRSGIVIRTPEEQEVEIAADEIALMTRMLYVVKERKTYV